MTILICMLSIPSAEPLPATFSCFCPSANSLPAYTFVFVRRRTVCRRTLLCLSIGELFAAIHFLRLSIGKLFAGIHFLCLSIGELFAGIHFLCLSIGELFAGIHFLYLSIGEHLAGNHFLCLSIGEHLAGNLFLCLSIGEHLAGNLWGICPIWIAWDGSSSIKNCKNQGQTPAPTPLFITFARNKTHLTFKI